VENHLGKKHNQIALQRQEIIKERPWGVLKGPVYRFRCFLYIVKDIIPNAKQFKNAMQEFQWKTKFTSKNAKWR